MFWIEYTFGILSVLVLLNLIVRGFIYPKWKILASVLTLSIIYGALPALIAALLLFHLN